MTTDFTPVTAMELPDALDTFAEEAKTPEFVVETLEQAIWASRRLASVEAKREKLRATAQAERERIDAWLDEALAPFQPDVRYFNALLEGYHRHVLAEDPKQKTVKLPNADLVARKQPDAWEFAEEAFLAWAAFKQPDLVRVKHEIDKPTAKKLLTVTDTTVIDANGEAVDGVSVTPGHVKFSVKVKA